MAIVAGDIEFRLAGGASNSDPNASLGGVLSTTTEITDATVENLFDNVTGDESTPGDTEYRSFYIQNAHGSLTYQLPKIWISTDNTRIDMALADEGVNVTMETIANESTAPTGGSGTAGTIAMSTTAPDIFGRAAGDFVADGFVIGQKIDTTNFTNGANNGTFTIVSVTASVVTVKEQTIATESAGADETMDSVIVWEHFTSKATGWSPGDIPTTEFIGVWVRRVIEATAPAEDADNVVITIEGDTAA